MFREKRSINSILKEADVYRGQGLLQESKAKYLEILEFIINHKNPSKERRLIASVMEKIRAIEDELAKIDKATENFQLSKEEEDLIESLFSFSETKEPASLERAVALAKFGQYERAVAEFGKLIKEGILPIIAAKHMLICHLNSGKPEAAVNQFRRWNAQNIFSEVELNYLRDLLQTILKEKGISFDRQNLVNVSLPKSKKYKPAEEVLEICGVGVKFDAGPRKGKTVNFDVTFQLDRAITIVINSDDKDFLDTLEPGGRLSQIQCFSPISFFNANAIVTKTKTIPAGPKKGDYSVDLKII